jgi:hypothetical protein
MALTGFLTHGRCLSDSASAMKMILSDFPIIQNATIFDAYAPTLTTPVAGTAGTATMYVHGASMAATTTYGPALKTFYVDRCDPAIPFDGLNVFSATVAASYWMWAMTMVLGVYLLANNAGAILRFLQGRHH